MMLHEQQVRHVQHYKYLDVVLHKPLYHTMRLDYNQVAVSNSILLCVMLANHQLTINFWMRIFLAVSLVMIMYALDLVGGW